MIGFIKGTWKNCQRPVEVARADSETLRQGVEPRPEGERLWHQKQRISARHVRGKKYLRVYANVTRSGVAQREMRAGMIANAPLSKYAQPAREQVLLKRQSRMEELNSPDYSMLQFDAEGPVHR